MKRIITLAIISCVFFTFTGMVNIEDPPIIIAKPIISLEPILPLDIEEQEVEYEVADYVWNYFKDLGYNDYVIAGILGNMMVECGGFTLDLDSSAETKTYYGICQWSKKFYPSVIGVSLDAQCDFLRDTIKYEIDTFGYKYTKGFKLDNFLAIDNERDAALAFAKSYERCNSGTYTLRQDCAEVAFSYFSDRV